MPTLPRQETRRRGDIQGLRAIAILTVVAYHAFPGALTGGYVGVDVFFVISGFLITGILLREQSETGRISLPGFWARRVRRLLPATIVVAVVTLAVAWFRLDAVRFARTAGDAAWAMLSLANVHFASTPAGAYFSNTAPSPFLHFWSLSVEEQFYLVLPLLLVAVAVVLRGRRWAVPALIAAVFAGSLAASVVLTDAADANAYYSLGTRAWELAIGGGLAWLTARPRPGVPGWARAAAFAAGLVAILAAASWYTPATPFPGTAALLPTLGTAAIIWSGTGGSAGPIGRILDNPVARWIGDISFSLYLWHWPILVLEPSLFAANPWLQLVAVAAAVGLAALTYAFVEQPFQRMRRRARPWRVLAIGLPSALVVVLVAGLLSPAPSGGGPVAPLPAQYRALDAGPGPMPDAVPSNAVPSLVDLPYDLQRVDFDCLKPTITICTFGDAGAAKDVLLIGDSFAGMWQPSLAAAAEANGWRLTLISKAGCPFVLSPGPVPNATADWRQCVEWQRDALAAARELRPDAIVWTNTMIGLGGEATEGWVEQAIDAGRALESIAPTLFIGATPGFPSTASADICLPLHLDDPAACSVPYEQAVPQVERDIASEVTASSGTQLVDLTGILCGDGVCPVIAGNVIMYRDAGHLTNAYSTRFADVFAALLRPTLG